MNLIKLWNKNEKRYECNWDKYTNNKNAENQCIGKRKEWQPYKKNRIMLFTETAQKGFDSVLKIIVWWDNMVFVHFEYYKSGYSLSQLYQDVSIHGIQIERRRMSHDPENSRLTTAGLPDINGRGLRPVGSYPVDLEIDYTLTLWWRWLHWIWCLTVSSRVAWHRHNCSQPSRLWQMTWTLCV